MNYTTLYKDILDAMSQAEKDEFVERMQSIWSKQKKPKRAKKRSQKSKWDYSSRQVTHTYTCKLCQNVSTKVYTVDTCARKDSPCYPGDLNITVVTCDCCLSNMQEFINGASSHFDTQHRTDEVLNKLLKTISEMEVR